MGEEERGKEGETEEEEGEKKEAEEGLEADEG